MATWELIRCPPHFRAIKIGVSSHFGVHKWRAFEGQICAFNMVWGHFVGLGFCEFRARRIKRACYIRIAFVSACFADRRGSAEIRGFRLASGIIGAQWWRVSDAAKQNLRKFCRKLFQTCGFFVFFFFFGNMFGTRDFALYFCIKWGFAKIFRCSRPRGCATNLSQIGVFWGVLSFSFGLLLLAAYLHDGWWRGCSRTTRRKKNYQWQQL